MASLEAAYAAWRLALGDERVISTPRDIPTHDGGGVTVVGVLKPANEAHVVSIVTIARENGVPLYPVSAGRNWGYGGAAPVTPGCAIVDLSGMNAITSVDAELGLVTLQPGVTIDQLRDFLRERNIAFRAPSVGIGGGGSVIGNALERGRSGTPIVDRSSSLMGLRAVLGDGSVYVSYPHQGDESTRHFFRWGRGPDVTALFPQSNFGIVTSATFALAPAPAYERAFLMPFRRESFAQAIDAMRLLLFEFGSLVTFVAVQNAERIQTSRQADSHAQEFALNVFKNTRDSNLVPEWALVGALEGDRRVVRAAASRARELLRFGGTTVHFFDERTLLALAALDTMPAQPRFLRDLSAHSVFVYSYMNHELMSEGTKRRYSSRSRQCYDLVGTYRGVRMLPVVLPLVGAPVARFADAAEAVFAAHGFSFTPSFLNFSERSAFVSLPLLFDPDDARQTHAADRCYEKIESIAHDAGGYYHRLSIQSMERSGETDGAAQKIKQALDPDGIIAPDRYVRVPPAGEQTP
jgi:4-cresol dehydrogenase (hydroxylating)